MIKRDGLIIGIVGPCAAGKTLLVEALTGEGYHARQISQEHSFVPDMWQRLTNPDILIYLDVSFTTVKKRRNNDYTPADHTEQINRLRHARQHANLYIPTDTYTPQEVSAEAITYLEDFHSE